MGVEQYIRAIQEDQQRGAAFLAMEALLTLKMCNEGDGSTVEDFREIARQLLTVRPGMPAIGHVVVRAVEMVRECYDEGLRGGELTTGIDKGLDELMLGYEKAHEATLDYAVRFLHGKRRILSMSWSSNVQDTLLRLDGGLERVYVAESRPLCEGREMAAQLAEGGISTNLITDAAMGGVLDKVDMCLVGADGVLQNGSLINKTGSYLLALAAAKIDVPVYSICETFKYHVGAVPYEAEIKPPEEICEAIPGVDIVNSYFEIVPASLISGYITDMGVISPRLASEQIHRWQESLSKKQLFGKW